MQMKTIAMMLAAGCALTMLTGCGIPEDEHNAILADMASKHEGEVDKLNGKIADLESLLKNEKQKVRTARIELDDATERIKGLQQKSAETSKALSAEKAKVATLESDLKRSKSATAAAEERATDFESKYSTLDVEFQELKRRFEQFRKNMSSLGSGASRPATTSPSAAPTGSAPMSDSEKALDLLNQMGSQ